MRVTRAEARLLLLAAQGLLDPPAQATKPDVLGCIRRMGALQIDTIHVVARSPYFVLWSRLGSYEPRWLEELLAERRLFEYWAHEACLLPVELYPLFRHRMEDPGSLDWKYSHGWLAEHAEVAERVMAHIRSAGEVKSSHFERIDGQSGGWWNLKPEKRALEYLFSAGALMVARRERFQRVYDLRERVLPQALWKKRVSSDAARRELTLLSALALGAATERWLADYFRLSRAEVRSVLPALQKQGKLRRAQLEGQKEDAWLHVDHLPVLAKIRKGTLRATRTVLLSPFDPVVWDRARAEALFDFEYRIECYTPAPRRKYGYFSLPILSNDRLVGRLDAKAHRKEKIFEVKSLHLEEGIEGSEELARGIAGALKECAAWHGTPRVKISKGRPAEFAKALRKALKH
ncbi:MAG TPA: crosslink repair DNA glycosylase YcaQ family protein [Thermoanaerobaculia bacterium]|nr:crosslink repair DNA glycosylase YcaQ family protein [Thermoanaerobaculia bacterium]